MSFVTKLTSMLNPFSVVGGGGGGASFVATEASGGSTFDQNISGINYRHHVYTNVTTDQFRINQMGSFNYIEVWGWGAAGGRGGQSGNTGGAGGAAYRIIQDL